MTSDDWAGVVSAFFDAGTTIAALLRSEAVAAQWSEPSVLHGYTVGAVAAHVVQATERVVAVLQEDEPEGQVADIPEFYGANRVSVDTDPEQGLHAAVRSSALRLADRGRDNVVERLDRCLRDLAPRLEAAGAERRVGVLQVPDGAATLDGYLRTRIVELVVHGDDIAQSVGVTLEPPPAAMDLALDVCLQMARAMTGDLGVLRVFVRQERGSVDDVRVL